MDEAIERQRHRRLEADDAERRPVELHRLLVGVMRRVVGGDGVDAAVGEPLQHRVAVGRGAQRRVHLEVRVVAQVLVGQDEVVRGDLARHRYAALLARAHRAQRLPRAHVRHVDRPAGQPAQADVPLDHDRFGLSGLAAQTEGGRAIALVHDAAGGQRRVLAVVDDRYPEHRRVLESPPHEERVGNRMPIVGDPDAAGLAERADLGHPLPPRAHRHRADRMDPGEPCVGRLADDLLGDADMVVDRIGVRHAGRRGESARHRGGHAARDRLLVLLPRLPKVDVHVDEAGTDDESGRHLHRRRAVEREIGADRRHPSALVDADVGHTVDSLCGIDDPPALENDRLHRHSAPSSASKPASR